MVEKHLYGLFTVHLSRDLIHVWAFKSLRDDISAFFLLGKMHTSRM